MADVPAPPKGKGGGFLGAKHGPLKGWQWLLVVGGGVGLALYLRSRAANAANATTAATAASPAADTTGAATAVPVSGGTTTDTGSGSTGSSSADLLGAYQAGEQSNAQAFANAGSFYQSVFGSALSLFESLYPAGGGSGGGGGGAPPPAAPPPAGNPNTITLSPTQQGYVGPGGTIRIWPTGPLTPTSNVPSTTSGGKGKTISGYGF